jgi:hypothetical protein
MLYDRKRDALVISDGACNPSGIAHAIIRACQDMRENENAGTAQLCSDPAIQLMVHQLAFLVGVGEFGNFDWDAARKACKPQ